MRWDPQRSLHQVHVWKGRQWGHVLASQAIYSGKEPWCGITKATKKVNKMATATFEYRLEGRQYYRLEGRRDKFDLDYNSGHGILTLCAGRLWDIAMRSVLCNLTSVMPSNCTHSCDLLIFGILIWAGVFSHTRPTGRVLHTCFSHTPGKFAFLPKRIKNGNFQWKWGKGRKIKSINIKSIPTQKWKTWPGPVSHFANWLF